MAENNTTCACTTEESGPTMRVPKNIVDKILVHYFSIVCFSMSIILTVLISLATFVRYILGGDLYGYEEWVKLFAFWLYFTGAGYGAFNNSHVSADIVQSYVPEGFLKRFLAVLKDAITLGVTLLYVYYGYDFFIFGYMGPLGTGIAIPMTTIWRIPLWTSYLAIFSGLICMGGYFTRNLVNSTLALLKGE